MIDRITPAEVREMATALRTNAALLHQWEAHAIAVVLEAQADKAEALAAQMEADDAERAELTASNELFMICMDRARRKWQAAHPESNVWPDGAQNIVWLLEQNDALAAKVAEYEERLQGRVLVKPEITDFTSIGEKYMGGRYGAKIVRTLSIHGNTPEEAITNLQAAIDKEAKHG